MNSGQETRPILPFVSHARLNAGRLSHLSGRALRRVLSWILVVYVACLSEGCKKDDEVYCETPVVSYIKFNYTGALSGTFQAYGEYVPCDCFSQYNCGGNLYEYAHVEQTQNYGTKMGIFAWMKNDVTNDFNHIQIEVPEGKGTYPLQGGGLDGVAFNIGSDNELGFNFSSNFESTITITDNRCGRLKGIFKGNAAGPVNQQWSHLTITDGEFDIAVLPWCK